MILVKKTVLTSPSGNIILVLITYMLSSILFIGSDRSAVYDIVLYKTPAGNSPVEEYIAKLAKKNKYQEIAAIDSYRKRLQNYGLRVNEKHRGTIKHIRDGIYELRPNTTRVFFFCFTGNRIVLLHAIEKKRKDVPPGEIEKAIQERKDYLRRNKDEQRAQL